MSFFGFDAKSQSRSHPAQAPGFGVAPDPFAKISGQDDDEGEAYASLSPPVVF